MASVGTVAGQAGETVLRAVVIYGSLLAFLRIGGRREMAQMTPMDIVLLLLLSEAVSPALSGGSQSIPLGLLSAASLFGCAIGVGLLSRRWRRFEALVEGKELVLIRDGKVREDVLRSQRMTDQDLRTVLHQQGLQSVAEVAVAFVEPSGKITIIEAEEHG